MIRCYVFVNFWLSPLPRLKKGTLALENLCPFSLGDIQLTDPLAFLLLTDYSWWIRPNRGGHAGRFVIGDPAAAANCCKFRLANIIQTTSPIYAYRLISACFLCTLIRKYGTLSRPTHLNVLIKILIIVYNAHVYFSWFVRNFNGSLILIFPLTENPHGFDAALSLFFIFFFLSSSLIENFNLTSALERSRICRTFLGHGCLIVLVL